LKVDLRLSVPSHAEFDLEKSGSFWVLSKMAEKNCAGGYRQAVTPGFVGTTACACSFALPYSKVFPTAHARSFDFHLGY